MRKEELSVPDCVLWPKPLQTVNIKGMNILITGRTQTVILGYFNKEKLVHHLCQEIYVTPTAPESTLNIFLSSFG